MKIYQYNSLKIDDWIEAGKKTSEALKLAKKLIDSGVSILDVTEKIEKKFNPAFPLNISMNEFAAHDSADINDDRLIEGVVKIDFGVNVNGAIGDAALTIDLTDKHSDLLEANKEALNSALNYVMKNFSEVSVNEIGKAVYDIALKHKFGVVRNLTGHGLWLNQIHTPPSIYNFPSDSKAILKPYFPFAIEPFFSYEDVMVKESGRAKIFQMLSLKPIRDSRARRILNYVRENFSTRPFASRWLLKEFREEEIDFALYKLIKNGNVYAYKPLKASNNAIISQFEHSVVLTNEKAIITTNLNEKLN